MSRPTVAPLDTKLFSVADRRGEDPVLVSQPGLASIPFFLAGGLKIVYDLLIYRAFSAVRPPDEPGEGPSL